MKTLSHQLCRPGFVSAPIERVAEALEQWLCSFGRLSRASIDSWPDARAHLVPVATADTRILLVPWGAWTLLLSNGHTDGGGGLVAVPARRLNIPAARATLLEDARQWMVFRHAKEDRGINAQRDGARWIFAAQGPVEPYENLAQYEARKKTDKVTVDLVRAYIRALTGLDYPPEWSRIDWGAAVGFVHVPGFEVQLFPTVDDL